MSNDVRDEDFVEVILGAAENHGRESEPDHEVGDLRSWLHACWDVMTPGQRHEVALKCRYLLEDWVK